MRKPTSNWIDRICQNCDKNFKVMPCVVKANNGKFCSDKCRTESYKIGLSEKNPNWRGGKSQYERKLDHKTRFPEKVRAREMVRHAVRYKQLIPGACGKCESTVNIEAHHADYSKPLDVKWLCRNCHKQLHRA